MDYSARESSKLANVRSDISKLNKVLIHRPDEGIEKVTPSSALELLYEDIVYLPAMIEEHDVFTKALTLFTGKENIYDIQQLLVEVLFDEEVKEKFINEIAVLEELKKSHIKSLSPLSPNELSKAVITGSVGDKTLFNPLPNLIFTRDIGVVVNNYIIACQASMMARKRENIVASTVFRHHPIFQSFAADRVIGKKELEAAGFFDIELSIEGGDIMMLDKGHLLIATSERTTEGAVKSLITSLFELDVVERITQVNLPHERYCMHLDTVFTIVNKNECVAFQPLIMKENFMPATLHMKNSKPEQFGSLQSLLLNENSKMEFVPCGEGVAPFAEREQWTDGCNLFAVKEGVAFTYDRNTKTNLALQERGYTIIKARELIEEVAKRELNVNSLEKTIITIGSSELSRARGGPHCMTMPISRG